MKCQQCLRTFSEDDLGDGLCVDCWDKAEENHDDPSPPIEYWCRHVGALTVEQQRRRRTWIIQSYNAGTPQADMARTLGVSRQMVWSILDGARRRGVPIEVRDGPVTIEQARSIRRQYARGGTSHRKLARQYGVAFGTIASILHNRTYKELAA